jgi:hypothetical protein
MRMTIVTVGKACVAIDYIVKDANKTKLHEEQELHCQCNQA